MNTCDAELLGEPPGPKSKTEDSLNPACLRQKNKLVGQFLIIFPQAPRTFRDLVPPSPSAVVSLRSLVAVKRRYEKDFTCGTLKLKTPFSIVLWVCLEHQPLPPKIKQKERESQVGLRFSYSNPPARSIGSSQAIEGPKRTGFRWVPPAGKRRTATLDMPWPWNAREMNGPLFQLRKAERFSASQPLAIEGSLQKWGPKLGWFARGSQQSLA